MKNATNWSAGDMARDPRDGEVVEVLDGRWQIGGLYRVKVITAGRGGPSGPSALAGEATHRALNDPMFPFERLDPLTGHEAIEYAERHGLLLAKATDPTEEARSGLTPDEARRIAAEDPSLIALAVAS